MKFNLIKLTLTIGLVVAIISSTNFMQENNNTDASCDNACLACQNTAYQMKFQKVADCNGAHCKNTCWKVKELWSNSPDGVFKPFEKDIFGKCEICFRAGFCTIGECKAQQEAELAAIDEIVNKSKLTAKKVDYVEKLGFEQFHKDLLFYDPAKLTHIMNELKEVKGKVDSKLDESVSQRNASGAIGEVKKILDGLFNNDNTFTGASVDELSNKPVTPEEVKKGVVQYTEAIGAYVANGKKIVDMKKDSSKASKEEKEKYEKIRQEKLTDIKSKLVEVKKILKSKKANDQEEVKAALKNAAKELKDLKHKLEN